MAATEFLRMLACIVVSVTIAIVFELGYGYPLFQSGAAWTVLAMWMATNLILTFGKGK